MKKTMLLALVFLAVGAYAQSLLPLERGSLIRSKVTYTNAADTTGYISTVMGKSIGAMKEVGLICTSTDSLQAAVYILGKNSKIYVGTVLAAKGLAYTDSISTILYLVNGHTAFATTPYYKVIMLKDETVNRIAGFDAFAIATSFSAAISDRALRTQKWYLWYKE